MNGGSVKKDNLPFLFAPAIKDVKARPETIASSEKKFLLSERADAALRRLVSLSHLADLCNWSILFGIESYYDMNKVPQNYIGLSDKFANLAPLELDPSLKSSLDSLGDVLEVSSLHLAGRAGLALVNELLLTKPVKEVTKSIFSTPKLQGIFEKFLDSETIDKYATNGEIQLSDEARFWVSLAPVLLFMSAHSLGYFDFGPDHWHGNEPVPWMIKGQFLAAASIVASHYVVKYPDKVSGAIRSIVGDATNSVRQLEQLLNVMSREVADTLIKSGKRIDSILVNGFEVLEERLLAGLNDFTNMHKMAGEWVDMELKVAELMLMDKLYSSKSNND